MNYMNNSHTPQSHGPDSHMGRISSPPQVCVCTCMCYIHKHIQV